MAYHNKPDWKNRQFLGQILRSILNIIWKEELEKEKHLKATTPKDIPNAYITHIPSKSWW